jgi:membrane-associated phospholipid phosphatase
MIRSQPSSRAPVALAGAGFAVALALAALVDTTAATDAGHAAPRLIAFGQFVTSFGTSGYMFAFSALIAFVAIVAQKRGVSTWKGDSLRLLGERAIYFFATIAASGILAQVIKHLVGRSRPHLLATDGAFRFHPLSFHNVLASFPSGHTTSAFAAAVALGFIVPRWRGAFLAFAMAIGLSRILVGAHFPSDVVGGAALGSLVALAMARSFARRGIGFVERGDRVVAKPLRLSATRPGPHR